MAYVAENLAHLLRYGHVYGPIYLLAVLMWTMLGRFVLGLFVPENWDNYIWRFFRRLTDPILALVRPITPGFMVEPLLPLVGVFWLLVARIAWWFLMFSLGWTPPVVPVPA